MLLILLFLALFFSIFYVILIKPYLTVKRLKRSFQAKGYKVLVQELNFLKQMVFPSFAKNFEQHDDSFYRMKTIYQKYDVTIQNSMGTFFLTLNNIDLLKDAYRNIQFMSKAPLLKSNLKRLYGGGLVMAQGKQWKEKRKLYSQIFNFKLLQDLHPHIQQASKNTMDRWKTNQQIDILQELRKVFFNVFVMSYFGCQFDGFSYKNQAYSQVIVKIFDGLLPQSITWRHILFGTKFLQKGFTKQDKQIEEQIQAIKIQTKEFVLKRFQEIQKNGNKGNTEVQNNILAKLVFNDAFQNISPEQKNKRIQDIVGDVLIFFFAGTDTTSATMTSTLHMLHKHPEVLKKIEEQIQSLPENYQPSTIKQLIYMDAVFNQTLRLYGPANLGFARQMTDDRIVLGDVAIPKGIFLGLQSFSIHHSQKYYERPNQFIPERWLNKKNQIPFSFISFGSGQRNCIGQHLARIQFKITLSMVIRNFKFTTSEKFALQSKFVYASAHNKFILIKKE